jgi:hypothetical protein
VSTLTDLSNNKISDSTGDYPIFFMDFGIFLWPFALVLLFSCPINLRVFRIF